MMCRHRLRLVLVLAPVMLCVCAGGLAASAVAADAEKKQILMVAGAPSHRYGAHEHFAGLRILQDAIEQSSEAAQVTLVRGWPSDEQIATADTIVIYSDGGRRHVAMDHRDQLRKRLSEGVGLVCLHYAVEMLPGESGKDWEELLGGHFEINYSVNPHWVAEFKSLPDHAITRGVQPFATDDEWYFHLRFTELGKVTPILSAVAPAHTMKRPDGDHSGNPHVRKSVAAGEPQTVAWAYERPDGGRSFGFTGGHHHWNWGNDDVRRLVTNAIRWTAGETIGPDGSSLGKEPVGIKRLLENQDYDRPKDFDEQATAERFQLTAEKKKTSERESAKPIYLSGRLTSETKRHRVEIDASIEGVSDLYLIIDDGGDGFACDWVDWVDPTIHGPDGSMSLVELGWQSATSGWGSVRKNANCSGKPWSVDGQVIGKNAIGTHADSVIHFKLPSGFNRLTVTGALDTGGTSQNGGATTSVRLAVYSGAAPATLGSAPDNAIDGDQRDPGNAIKGITIADGLEATLAACEPMLRSLTNLDIDSRGRVWVCDVMNYRGNQGSRPEGDRILILEDTDGDGVMDDAKTFYQGRDIDSAMGICVLENATGADVIVTASPNVWRFVDSDGDDVPDSKNAMFTGVGNPQHDHSGHSFLFGPDGKLYWNFGNTGEQVKDSDGETVIDIHGRAVVDNGAPLLGGMPFRCDLDGGNFEVLAHNFRNNWETTVDSFGTLWQSDNDDDGNRGTRINFVMEHGNYGYRDEITGGGWREPRINQEDEIMHRHWHLNDPGVVPNMLQTGAGSPSGICFYEGRLLPERFWDQIIHCDPGPNMVRAYPSKPDGAGYSATIEPLMTGTVDRWFRPADVCTAPDGSLFVTDWYDPGVGGHRQGDSDRGRLFRLAPPGTDYKIPTFDFTTPGGAVEALRNPTLAVRARAWRSLHAMGPKAEPALLQLYADSNPRLRARALWLLGKIDGRGEHYVAEALADANSDLRITAIRLAKQLTDQPSLWLADAVDDPSAAVRRELAVALRYDTSDAMPSLWAQLATSYDGQDRWYLEALGIGSDVRAAECFDAYLEAVDGRWDTPAGRDLVWRVRAPKAADAMVALIADPKRPLNETDRYFRSLEFHGADVRDAALKRLLP
ncbi:PVC-type heme-binding CxxCH protein [Stieleria maiorica]|uniref:PVC-type heme-binding CxxCH protein n=1 Tax=Stieleria maiorica TaxID=2795974 RepID=UPI0011C8CAD4|nr:PVC-type heme-binding CxxCH protein [Stieleria maiorica]